MINQQVRFNSDNKNWRPNSNAFIVYYLLYVMWLFEYTYFLFCLNLRSIHIIRVKENRMQQFCCTIETFSNFTYNRYLKIELQNLKYTISENVQKLRTCKNDNLKIKKNISKIYFCYNFSKG